MLTALFHWSPADRRETILSEGLRPYAPPAVSGGDIAWPYLCFGTSPQGAWRYSGGMGYEHFEEYEAGWDLWQVTLAERDEVHVLPCWGPAVHEVRVHNAIPADRLWYVGRRTVLVARCAHGATTHAECAACFPDV